MMRKGMFCVLFLGSLLLTGCAFDLAHVSFTRTELTPRSGKSLKIREETPITGAPCGYTRAINNGTTWKLIGSIPEGEVYQSKDQVLTVECSNIHQAYPVVSGSSLVGFYLPVERGFVKMSEPILLNAE